MRNVLEIIQDINVVISELRALEGYDCSNDIELYGGINPLFTQLQKKGFALVNELFEVVQNKTNL